MKTPTARRAAIALPGLLAFALAAASHAETPDMQTQSLFLSPGKVHEVCLPMAAGQRLDFRFEADQALAFNLHYHEGEAVLFPIEEHDARAESGEFEAPPADGEERTYCLMWTNRQSERAGLGVWHRLLEAK